MRVSSRRLLRVKSAFLWFLITLLFSNIVSAQTPWQDGAKHFKSGDYQAAAASYETVSSNSLSPELFQNLGLAEWKNSNTGPAILAWERALWLNPRAAIARNNLRFARRSALLAEPDTNWYEICSGWFSATTWAVLAAVSFWVTLSLMFLPGWFKLKKNSWMQMLAAAGFALFLLTLPAMYGIYSRTHIAIVVAKDSPVLLTPTKEGQVIIRIPNGETARVMRRRGEYCYVNVTGSTGWMHQSRLGFIAAE